MNRRSLFLILALLATAPLFTSCITMSEDPAPGGITATNTGMDRTSAVEWQDRTIRQLAY